MERVTYHKHSSAVPFVQAASARPDARARQRAHQVACVLAGVREFLFLVALTLLTPAVVAVDVVITRQGVAESALTELTQEGLLLFSVLLFLHAAARARRARGFHVLAAGFFAAMLVRELDSVFDHVWQGFWLWPALGVSAGQRA